MVFGEEICSKYRIINHNCDHDLASVGMLSSGMELLINKHAVEADLLITTGLVGLHYFAGYSGGRKSILPGIASRSAIEASHKMMSDTRACLGNYQNNPVSDLMVEAAEIAGVDFIVNVVTGSHNEILHASAGHVYHAWIDAVRFAEQMSVVTIPEKADIVIASCGGYPKDINMYQAQKALDSASLGVKDGGTIILLAECPEGLGEDTFEEWVMTATCTEDIEKRFFEKFELGGHKAYAICRTLRKAEIYLHSSLQDNIVKDLFMHPVHDLQDLISVLLKQYDPEASVIIMPEAPKIALRVNGKE
jgi:nickel-dependent lactate racemase